MTDLISHSTDDGKSQIQPRVDLSTVWHTKLEQALYSVVNQRLTTESIGYQRPTVKNFLTVQERFV